MPLILALRWKMSRTLAIWISISAIRPKLGTTWTKEWNKSRAGSHLTSQVLRRTVKYLVIISRETHLVFSRPFLFCSYFNLKPSRQKSDFLTSRLERYCHLVRVSWRLTDKWIFPSHVSERTVISSSSRSVWLDVGVSRITPQKGLVPSISFQFVSWSATGSSCLGESCLGTQSRLVLV